MTKHRALFSAIAVGALCAGTAQADALDHASGHMYMGAGVGYLKQSSVLSSAAAQDQQFQSLNGASTQAGGGFAGRIFAGYTVTDNIAVELGYLHALGVSSGLTVAYPGAGQVTANGKLQLNGFDLSMLLRPSESTGMHNLFGRVGVSRWTAKNNASFSVGGVSTSSTYSTSGTGWLVGGGYDYPIDQTWAVRAEATYYAKVAGLAGASAINLGVSVIGRF